MFSHVLGLLEDHLKTEDPTDRLMKIIDAITLDEAVGIIYCDADHVISVRVIVPQSYQRCKNGSIIVRAFCEQRQAVRQFRISQIVAVEA